MLPYLFYNYTMSGNGNVVNALEQVRMIKKMVGIEVAYRKKDARPIDRDTCIITPSEYTVDIGTAEPVKVMAFGIARHIISRDALKWDRTRDAVDRVTRTTDEDVLGEMLLLPEYGKLAVADRVGETYLSATSTLGRFKAVIQSNKGYAVDFGLASSISELQNALKAWKLSEFSFSARPFNPSVQRQGQKVHEILQPNNAKLQGRVTPYRGPQLEYKENTGIMWEVVGLAEKGYAEYGAKGTTAYGESVQIKKTDPTGGRPPIIKMFLEGACSAYETGKSLARALLDIHGEQ